MRNKLKIFKLLRAVIVALIAILIAINVLYVKAVCSTMQCFAINIATMFLLLWVVAFWFLVVKYADKDIK